MENYSPQHPVGWSKINSGTWNHSKGLFTHSDLVTVKGLALCQWLTGRMGMEPILPVKQPVTIDIMLNFDSDGHGDGSECVNSPLDLHRSTMCSVVQ